jgi:diguanylate cyclase (GGDEF)-like protein
MVLSFSLAATNPPALTIEEGKAHYIIEVIKHITWPNEDDITNFNIVMIGHDKKLLDALNIKAKRIIRGKTLSIQPLENLSEIKENTEIVFVSKKKSSLIPDINNAHSNTLIISGGAAKKRDLMVGLLVTKKNIKLTLNREHLIRNGFKVSNSLLDFAGTKADLIEQLIDKENTLNQAIHNAKAKEAQLAELNFSLTKNKEKLAKIQYDLAKQNDQVFKVKSELASLKSDKEGIQLELANKKNDLLSQQKLITQKEIEHQEQEQKLLQLKLAIEQHEEKRQKQIGKLKRQSNIIERKEQEISGQQQLLYITMAIALIILILKFITLRVSRNRKRVNEELASLNEQLYVLATKDDMTKLFNRRHFLELAKRELHQIQRTKSTAVVLMIDIDHFKDVNDNFGHAAGDKAIINIANILKENLREYDIVGRVGGEEFAMLLPNSEIDIAMQIAERIRSKVANLSTLFQKSPIKLTVSIGLTAKKINENSINSMLQRADKALYQAKNTGRDKVTLL